MSVVPTRTQFYRNWQANLAKHLTHPTTSETMGLPATMLAANKQPDGEATLANGPGTQLTIFSPHLLWNYFIKLNIAIK